MENSTAQHLYKELRVNLEPENPNWTVTIRLPAEGSSGQIWRTPRRKQATQAAPAEDETAFAKNCLASSAFLAFRPIEKHPQSILGRILNDGKVLSIQPVDLTRPGKHEEHEPLRHLQFVFSNSIRPTGVSYAEHEERGSLDVFVLTSSNDLYTIALLPEFFHAAAVPESSNIIGHCKSYLSPSFGFRFPHRLAARHARELFVALHDGGLLRLTRKPGEDGSAWTETFYNEGGWGSSIRNLIPWQGNHTIQYGDLNLEQDTLTSFACTARPEGQKANYLFAVSLNHKLKAWNLFTGKMEFSRDLLNRERWPREMPKFLIDPSQSDLITVVDHKPRSDIDGWYLATFSPIGAGQFKFWAVMETATELVLQDLYPNHTFEPSPSSAEVWSMAHFKLVQGPDHRKTEMWILWKNNTSYRVENMSFDLLDVSEYWEGPWTSAATECVRDRPLPPSTSTQPADPTGSWIEYIFFPGHFTNSTLETALSIYNRSLKISVTASAKGTKSLKDRVCSSVGSTVVLGRNDDEGMDYERFCTDTDFQWRRFFRIVSELDKQRGEAIHLDYDPYSGMAWVVNADGITVVRRCNDTEFIWHNRAEIASGEADLDRWSKDGLLKPHPAQVAVRMARLIKAASVFQECFSDALLQSCLVVLQSEVFQDPSYGVSARIRFFYDRCNFSGQISDEDYSQLAREIDHLGGFKALDTVLFESILRLLSSKESNVIVGGLRLTAFGERTMVKGAQELIHVNINILFNLLVLLVFVEIEENGQDGAQANLDTPSIYLSLLRLYRVYSTLEWFSKTPRAETSTNMSPDADHMARSDGSLSPSAHNHRASTVLQYPWIRMWEAPQIRPSQPMSVSLTKFISNALAGIGLSFPKTYDQQVMWLQRTFLRRGETDLAAQFLRYQPNTAWSKYLRARFYLCTGQYGMAAAYFRKAAFNLAHGDGKKELSVNETDDLLTVSDSPYFHSGLPMYYLHVVKLFEKAKAYSFAMEFAKLGLQFTSMRNDEGNTHSQTELLSRSFNAALKTSSFDEAYSALMRYPHTNKQRNDDLTRLISTMCEEGQGARLISYPFLALHHAVDEVLAARSRSIANIRTSPPYHAVLYAWRLKRGDFRGAAVALHERLQRLQTAPSSSSSTPTSFSSSADADPENTPVTQGYLALINTLATLDPEQAWLLSSSLSSSSSSSSSAQRQASTDDAKTRKNNNNQSLPAPTNTTTTTPLQPTKKRTVLTLTDVRTQYQSELDRIALIVNDRFSFAADQPDDDDDDDDADEGAEARLEVDVEDGMEMEVDVR